MRKSKRGLIHPSSPLPSIITIHMSAPSCFAETVEELDEVGEGGGAPTRRMDDYVGFFSLHRPGSRYREPQRGPTGS